MSDERDVIDEPTPDEVAALEALLARDGVWDDPPAGLDDAIVTAIAAEADRAPLRPPAPTAPVRSLDDRRRDGRRSTIRWWLAAAAAVVVAVAGVVVATQGGDDDEPGGLLVALAPAEAAGDASASARVSSTPAGLKIVLDVDGLPGAPDGSFYEAWLSDGETRISAGTFHLRNGDNPIALWAGVADPAFNRLSVTLEPLDGDAGSSGDVRFAGEFDFADVDG